MPNEVDEGLGKHGVVREHVEVERPGGVGGLVGRPASFDVWDLDGVAEGLDESGRGGGHGAEHDRDAVLQLVAH